MATVSSGIEWAVEACGRHGWLDVRSYRDLESLAELGRLEVGPVYVEAIGRVITCAKAGDLAGMERALDQAEALVAVADSDLSRLPQLDLPRA